MYRPTKSLMLLAVASLSTSLGLQAQAIRPDADPRIEKLVASVSQQRLQATATKLAGFGTRSTLSDTVSTTRGIGAARRWIYDEFKRMSPRLQVSYDRHMLAQQGRISREVELVNVVAVLPGKSARRVYITGHYDTVNSRRPAGADATATAAGAAPSAPLVRPTIDNDSDAPGANDDGSGTSLTMELARVFAESGIEFDATLVFVTWAGEEQGLIGSMAHATALRNAKGVVEANFNNDIVGSSLGGNGIIDGESVKIYSLGPEDSPNRSLARYVQRVAGTYVPSHTIRLMAREDRFGRGSDHSSFTANDFPAIVFREANENYERQHSPDDKLEGMDFRYLAQNTRVNAASAASVALAPPAPRVTTNGGSATIGRGTSGYDASLQWQPSAGAVAYRVYWRDAWTNDWQKSQVVGNVTKLLMPNVSIDDYVFGVAAIGADGNESVISAYVSPVRKMTDVLLKK
ncbi:M20/M25/M40 family metallo-hydrolase [Gemmatimonas groenlandica]|uniref:M20/M25/M40 family metallo-hydrolase n=1 Tax=Gemmatimonas groenlandica TaxID=2732249 RepID=A0A6M4ISR4_9BACT|nr:M20/M25/M40 family metallo-hydrolase [Gemmatimonas groenlandica]QJR37128.1 M20/M25/M40 family metallo-hydrolase [Gemmatimonas groenlandica]